VELELELYHFYHENKADINLNLIPRNVANISNLFNFHIIISYACNSNNVYILYFEKILGGSYVFVRTYNTLIHAECT
jgi:hypothetical protein